MKKNLVFMLLSAVVLILALVACQPEVVTETVEVTRVVTETIEVEGEEVEVTRVVTETETQEVEVTRVVETESADPAMAERQKTVIFDTDQGIVLDPELWNPFAAGRRLEHGFMQAVAEPLVILNYENGEYMPWLAESFDANEDASVWTLKLREGIKWSDGEVFDADDVIFTVDMVLANPDMNAPAFEGLDNMEKVDDLTVAFNLAEPNVRFVDANIATKQGGGFIVVPEHIWSAVDDPLTFNNYDPEQGWPVFTGPYTLDSASENEFVYVRDDGWWGVDAGFQDLPAPEQLVWIAYGSEETRTAAMAKNDLDSLMNVNLGSYLALQQLNPNIVAWTPELPFTWIDPCSRSFDFNLTKEPWNDPEMRMAINYAINRDQIVEIAYEGTTIPSRSYFPAFPPLEKYVDAADAAGLFEQYPIMTYDPEQAKAIIESKGYVMNEESGYYEKDGEEFGMTITGFDDTEFNDVAALIVEQMQELGINAVHDIQPIPAFIDNLLGAGFDTYVFFSACGSTTEPWQSMDAFNVRHIPAEGEAAAGFYTNTPRWNTEAAAAYSEIVDAIEPMPLNDPAIEDMYVESMDYWMSELPSIPLVEAIKLVPFDETYWTGWPTKDNNYVQPATWWQSAHVIIHNLEPTN